MYIYSSFNINVIEKIRHNVFQKSSSKVSMDCYNNRDDVHVFQEKSWLTNELICKAEGSLQM